jgi:hypothetical protein
MKSRIMEEYYAWLYDIISDNMISKTYWQLSKALYRKEFKWFIPNDDNRAYEGRNLREKFCEELDIEYDLQDFEDGVSMLELIMALAYRCESIMADTIDRPMADWFLKLLENAGLTRYDDDNYDDLMVDEILTKIIERTYRRNGWGGLFPLRKDKKDQRKVELWYQMNAYLVENYYDDEVII